MLKRMLLAPILVLSLAARITAGPFEDANTAYINGDYSTALRLFRPLAERGDAAAQNNLAVLYAEGHGVPRNYVEAVKWYRRAADQGYALAQYNLGQRYTNGQGVPQNHTEAVKWYRRAADQCYPNAQVRLGIAYSKGGGVPQDHAEAVKRYHAAAEQGYAYAQLLLGGVYTAGVGVPQDLVGAYVWFTLSAAQGVQDAIASRDKIATYMNPAQIAEAEKLVREWKTSACVLPPLAQRRAAAIELEVKFRTLSDDQKTKLTKEMASVQNTIPRAELDTYLHAIQFLSPTVGLALDWHGLLHRTSDGGLTWTESRLPFGGGVVGWLSKRLNVPAPDIAPFRNMHFADDRFGLIVGGTGILQSEDGGVTWKSVRSPSRMQLGAAYCSAGHACWVAGGEAHVIFRRRDPRSAWLRQSSPAEGIVWGFQFIDDSVGWAITLSGEVIGTRDGGGHWSTLFKDNRRHFYGLHFINERLGWAVGADAVIMRTEDGGKTWVDQKITLPPNIPIKEVRLHDVKFADAEHGWAAGLHGMILATADGGESWTLQRFEGLPSNLLTIYSLAITDGPTIWAAGNVGNIVVSIDGGTLWFPVHGAAFQVYDVMRRFMERLPNLGSSSVEGRVSAPRITTARSHASTSLPQTGKCRRAIQSRGPLRDGRGGLAKDDRETARFTSLQLSRETKQ